MGILPQFNSKEIKQYLQWYDRQKGFAKRYSLRQEHDYVKKLRDLVSRNNSGLTAAQVLNCLYGNANNIPQPGQASYDQIFKPILRQLLRHDHYSETNQAVATLHNSLKQDTDSKKFLNNTQVAETICRKAPETPIGLRDLITNQFYQNNFIGFVNSLANQDSDSHINQQIATILQDDYDIACYIEQNNPQSNNVTWVRDQMHEIYLLRYWFYNNSHASSGLKQDKCEKLEDKINDLRKRLNNINKLLNNNGVNSITQQEKRRIATQIKKSDILGWAIQNQDEDLFNAALQLTQGCLDIFTGGYNQHLLKIAHLKAKQASDPSVLQRMQSQLVNHGFADPRALQQQTINQVAFPGGGAKGVAAPGVYQAYRDSGLMNNVKYVSGTSIGAITSLLIASGMTPEEINEALEKNDMLELVGGDKKLGDLTKAVKQGYARETDKLVGFLRQQSVETIIKRLNEYGLENLDKLSEKSSIQSVYDKLQQYQQTIKQHNICYSQKESPLTFQDLRTLAEGLDNSPFKRLHVNATDKNSGEEVLLNDEQTPDVPVDQATLASASLPGFFKPVSVNIEGDSYELVDGYLVDNLTHNKQAQGQVLKAGFGEGKRWDDPKNSVHQSLHGSDNNQKPYNPSMFSQLARNQIVPKMGRIQTSGEKVTDKKNEGFHQLSEHYSHYANNIRSGALSTTNFKKAKHYSSLLASINYITTMRQVFNYGYMEPSQGEFQKALYDRAEQAFYESIVRSYECDARFHYIDNKFVSSNNQLMQKSYSEKLNEIIQHVHEQANPDSPEAKAFIKAVNHYQKNNLKLNDMLNIGAALDQVIDDAKSQQQFMLSNKLQKQKQSLKQQTTQLEDAIRECIKVLKYSCISSKPPGPEFFEPSNKSQESEPIEVFTGSLNGASKQFVNQLVDAEKHQQQQHEKEQSDCNRSQTPAPHADN